MGDDRWFSSYKDTYLAIILKLNHKETTSISLEFFTMVVW